MVAEASAFNQQTAIAIQTISKQSAAVERGIPGQIDEIALSCQAEIAGWIDDLDADGEDIGKIGDQIRVDGGNLIAVAAIGQVFIHICEDLGIVDDGKLRSVAPEDISDFPLVRSGPGKRNAVAAADATVKALRRIGYHQVQSGGIAGGRQPFRVLSFYMIIIGSVIQVFVQIAGGSGGSEFHIVAINPVELGIALRSTPTEVSGAFAYQIQNQVFRREEIGHYIYDHVHRV